MNIPRFSLDFKENIFIPHSLLRLQNSRLVKRYSQNYELCLVGERESVLKDLGDFVSKLLTFIHFDHHFICDNRSLLSHRERSQIRQFNKLISNPKNQFNRTPLGIHTLGLVPKKAVPLLLKGNDQGLKYGLRTLYGLRVYSAECKCKSCCKCDNFDSESKRVSRDNNINISSLFYDNMIIETFNTNDKHWSSDRTPNLYSTILSQQKLKKSLTFLWSESYIVLSICRVYYISQKRIEIGCVWVNDKLRGQYTDQGEKISVKFMKKVIENIWKKYPKSTMISLIVLEENIPAIKLYQKLNFTFVEKMTSNILNIKDGLYMVLYKK